MLVESTTSRRGHGGQQGTISLSQILQNRPGGLTDTGQIKNCLVAYDILSYAIHIFSTVSLHNFFLNLFTSSLETVPLFEGGALFGLVYMKMTGWP